MRFFFELSPWKGSASWIKIDGYISFCLYLLPRFYQFKFYRIPPEKGNANGFILTFQLAWLFFSHYDFTLRIAK